MDVTLTKQQLLARQLFRDFALREVKDTAQEIDETERFPEELVKKMQKAGLMNIPVSRKYGGAGGDLLTYALCIEELSKFSGTASVIVCAHTSLCSDPIEVFGTEEQKQKYLVPLATGKALGAFGLTEPNAGSDASGQQSSAVLEGDHYVLNGTKIFITNAGYANTYIVAAMTDKSAGVKGISTFIVESAFPGFSVGKKEPKMGIRGSSTCELIFNNCIVPKENLLGKEGKGFNLAMATLEAGRIGVAAQALGIAQGALDVTVAYVKERKQFGRTISAFQNTQFELANMKARIEAARYLVYGAAAKHDAGLPCGLDSSMAKLYAAETATWTCVKGLQLFGGYGYTREYPIERMLRDAKITEIYEGTSEVQRMIISGALLK
jgi:butyryl-CoA dehydrogenase